MKDTLGVSDLDMNIVLIWASNNPEKYGNKILKDLVGKGYTVYPVNPKESEIEGITAYWALADISEKYEVVNFVVPPVVTLKILEENRDILIGKKIWCQPGSSDEAVKKFLEDHGFDDSITDSCIMLTKLS